MKIFYVLILAVLAVSLKLCYSTPLFNNGRSLYPYKFPKRSASLVHSSSVALVKNMALLKESLDKVLPDLRSFTNEDSFNTIEETPAENLAVNDTEGSVDIKPRTTFDNTPTRPGQVGLVGASSQ